MGAIFTKEYPVGKFAQRTALWRVVGTKYFLGDTTLFRDPSSSSKKTSRGWGIGAFTNVAGELHFIRSLGIEGEQATFPTRRAAYEALQFALVNAQLSLS